MNTLEAIRSRRSIRKFRADSIPRETIEMILEAGIDAPSGKNRQPWRFIVVTEKEREGMIQAMGEGLAALEAMDADPTTRLMSVSARNTMRIMAAAPVTIFILNKDGKDPFLPLDAVGERFWDLVNVQSIGGCIQNMCLAATSLGLGSLWICDVFSAYPNLAAWLGTSELMVGALSIGVPDEAPARRPRKAVDEVTVWR